MLLRNLFHKVQANHLQYTYHQGPIYTNGALQMVFDKRWEYPLVMMKGAGQIAGQWHSRQNPQLRVQMALTQTTLKAAGQIAGQIDHQPLMDNSPDANAAIGAI